jgi:hypothetical protein
MVAIGEASLTHDGVIFVGYRFAQCGLVVVIFVAIGM